LFIFGGEKGGPSFYITLNTDIMIDIRLNSVSKFGIGFEFRAKELHYYSMKRLDIHLLVITISFVITKFNI